MRWTRRLDRAANRGLERAHPALLGARYRLAAGSRVGGAWLGPRLRPPAARFLRALAAGERWMRRVRALAVRAATAASEVATPLRALAAVIVVAGGCLVVSQFVDYRAVQIGQPGYANLPDVASPPTAAARSAGQAHSYLLVPLGALAMLIGIAGLGRERPRRAGLLVAAVGLVSVAVILLVDRPAGLDAGSLTSRFAGASAVLEDGFYAELAAAAALLMSGLLYYARPCRIRISSSGRAASGRRRRPRRRASSPARVARSA
ncbi:MAG TPA: hypothetical protein VHI77_11855 [Solirubrobacterales bacterium]|nr:hypothetical protein [Solirubrobacterales bacterium]